MVAAGYITDRGRVGLVHQDKPLVFRGASWLDPAGSVSLFEDFITDTIAEDTYTVSQSGTALTAANIAVGAGPTPVGHGGWIQGKTDDVDGEIDEIALGRFPFLNPTRAGNGVLVAEAGFVIPTALTARQYFFGLSDNAAGTGGADDDGPIAINTGTTLISGVTDSGVGFVYSSLATDADGFYMGAVKATVVGTAVLASAGSLDTVAVDNYIKLRVEVDSAGNCYFYGAEDLGTANRAVEKVFLGAQATAITADILYQPIFTAASTTTTGVEWEVDYIFGACAA